LLKPQAAENASTIAIIKINKLFLIFSLLFSFFAGKAISRQSEPLCRSRGRVEFRSSH
jgi:hypothetical protein